jgi:hypothetical protein
MDEKEFKFRPLVRLLTHGPDLANKHARRHVWRRKKIGEAWTPESVVSEAELLNRVILAKALMVYASDQTMHFKTGKEDFEITPRVAKDVMRAAGQLPRKTRKKSRAGT